jgi:hypothetical protein
MTILSRAAYGLRHALRDNVWSTRRTRTLLEHDRWTDTRLQALALIDDRARARGDGRLGRRRIENELTWPFEAPKLLATSDAAFAGIPVKLQRGALGR